MITESKPADDWAEPLDTAAAAGAPAAPAAPYGDMSRVLDFTSDGAAEGFGGDIGGGGVI